MRTYLIDGYNLLKRIPELACHQDDELDKQRERLIRRLVALTASRQMKIHLVFDTSGARQSRINYPGVTVEYASPTADARIRFIIERKSGDRDLIVVSSDRKDVGHYAKICGVTWMTSGQFWKTISTRVSKSASKRLSEETGSAPPGWTAEDDDWIRRAFGGDDKSKTRNGGLP